MWDQGRGESKYSIRSDGAGDSAEDRERPPDDQCLHSNIVTAGGRDFSIEYEFRHPLIRYSSLVCVS